MNTYMILQLTNDARWSFIFFACESTRRPTSLNCLRGNKERNNWSDDANWSELGMPYISNFDNGRDGFYPPGFTAEFVVRRSFPPISGSKSQMKDHQVRYILLCLLTDINNQRFGAIWRTKYFLDSGICVAAIFDNKISISRGRELNQWLNAQNTKAPQNQWQTNRKSDIPLTPPWATTADLLRKYVEACWLENDSERWFNDRVWKLCNLLSMHGLKLLKVLLYIIWESLWKKPHIYGCSSSVHPVQRQPDKIYMYGVLVRRSGTT